MDGQKWHNFDAFVYLSGFIVCQNKLFVNIEKTVKLSSRLGFTQLNNIILY